MEAIAQAGQLRRHLRSRLGFLLGLLFRLLSPLFRQKPLLFRLLGLPFHQQPLPFFLAAQFRINGVSFSLFAETKLYAGTGNR